MNRLKESDMLLEQMTSYAALGHIEKLSQSLPDENTLDKTHEFSRAFEEKISLLFAQQKRKQRNKMIRKAASRAAVAVLVLLMVFTATIYSVDAFRVEVLNFLRNSDIVSNTIRLSGDEADYKGFEKLIRGMYLPSYIPPGYFIDSIYGSNENYRVFYLNDNEQELVLTKITEATTIGIDNEHTTLEHITVNKEEALLYLHESGYVNLLFKFDSQAFMISGYIEKNDAIKMAENMKYFK